MTWHDFVIAECQRARPTDLAAVVGQPVETVERIRRQVGGPRRVQHDFGALFTRWHGRRPRDDEWPRPRRFKHGYEWQAPELVVLVGLLGRVGTMQLARVLTERLRRVTGDPAATRDVATVKRCVMRMGLSLGQVVGGMTTAEAARRAGETTSLIHQEVGAGRLRHFKIGHRIVIPQQAVDEWKARRLPAPPARWIKLWSIREALGSHGDQLAYHAKHGRVPGVRLCSGKRYWIPPHVARDLLRRRRLGLRMPWHGWTHPSVARRSWDLWRRRRHRACAECRRIWGGLGGEPRSFAPFYERWLKIPEATKRHLTLPEGISSAQAQRLTGIDRHDFAAAARRGELKATRIRGGYVMREVDVLAWARHQGAAPSRRSRGRMTLKDAGRFVGSMARVRAAIRRGDLTIVRRWDGTPGVRRHEVGRLALRFRAMPVARAARLCHVSVPTFRRLAAGTFGRVLWRPGERVHPQVVQAVRGRIEAPWQVSIDGAAVLLGRPRWWVVRAIELGHLLPLRATGDARRIVLGRKAILALKRRRLTVTPAAPVTRGRPVTWLALYEACALAGVTASTVRRWDARGWLVTGKGKAGTLRGGNGLGRGYSRGSVMRAARRYWKTCRFKRATPPAWLRAEAA